MGAYKQLVVLIGLLTLFGVSAEAAGKSTVCTITVNSADEREVFRRYLPEDRFDFVELVEKGRSDWLTRSCRRGVSCDVLIVSGHFAGTEFYSSKPDRPESLPVEEIERAQCGGACPGLFGNLKEVYLFGCDSLKPDPVKSAMPEIVRGLVEGGASPAEAMRRARELSVRYGEASRDTMRRLFPNVPVIYGFSSLAPYGRVAGPMLEGFFRAGEGAEIGSGSASSRLVKLFAPASMVLAAGQRDGDPHADFRAESCRAFDDRVAAGDRVRLQHERLARPMPEMRMAFASIERFFATRGEAERADPTFVAAMQRLAADVATRESYLAVTRATSDPALRLRMIELARTLGWLDEPQHRAEQIHLVRDLFAAPVMTYGEVDLVCALGVRPLDHPGSDHFSSARKSGLTPGLQVAHAAASACLGSGESRGRVLRALASPQEEEVQLAQAYLRHRPITDGAELRAVAAEIARMKSPQAQARAIETLARQHVSDPQVLDELARLFARSSSLAVQRAIAEVFVRAGTGRDATLAATFRKHRVRSGSEDLIDVLLRRLEG
jgi:hypothetical protein